MTHRERNGQTDAEAVLYELRDLVDQRRVSLRHSREWQHYDMHEQVNQRAVKESAKDRMTDQKWEFAAGQIVDRCRAQRDQEMEDDSEDGSPCSSAVGMHAQNAAGDSLRNEDRFFATVNRDCVSQVQYADNQASDEDR